MEKEQIKEQAKKFLDDRYENAKIWQTVSIVELMADFHLSQTSELSDEEITDDLIMALLDDIYSGDNKDVIPKFRKFLEMYRTLPSESEQTVKELSDEEIRPNFKEIFGDGKEKTIFDVQDAATSQPELFRYAQALDKYIDYLESNRTHATTPLGDEICEQCGKHKRLHSMGTRPICECDTLAQAKECKCTESTWSRDAGCNVCDNCNKPI